VKKINRNEWIEKGGRGKRRRREVISLVIRGGESHRDCFKSRLSGVVVRKTRKGRTEKSTKDKPGRGY